MFSLISVLLEFVDVVDDRASGLVQNFRARVLVMILCKGMLVRYGRGND